MKTGNTLFVYTDLGFSTPVGENGIQGTLFNPGIGYKIMVTDWASLNLSVGYSSLSRESRGSGSDFISTSVFKIGLQF